VETNHEVLHYEGSNYSLVFIYLQYIFFFQSHSEITYAYQSPAFFILLRRQFSLLLFPRCPSTLLGLD